MKCGKYDYVYDIVLEMNFRYRSFPFILCSLKKN